jgi:hypothetical protein
LPNSESKNDPFFSGLSAGGEIGDTCARGVEGERGGVIGAGWRVANGLGGGIGAATGVVLMGALGGVLPYDGLDATATVGVLFTTRPGGIMFG